MIMNILDASNATLCSGVLVPNQLFNVVAAAINLIKIAVPVLLIVFGMMDFAKSVVAKDEDDVKKFRKQFISRVVSAILVYLIVFVVQLAVNMVSSVEDQVNEEGQTISDVWSCSKKFINGVDSNKVPENNTEKTEE